MKKKVIFFVLQFLCFLVFASGPKGILIEIEDPAGVNPISSYITFDAWIENSGGVQESITLDETGSFEPWGYPTADKYLYVDMGNFENFTPGDDYYVWAVTDVFHIEVTYNDGSDNFTIIKEYELTDSNPVSYLIDDSEGIQFGSVQEVTNTYIDDSAQNFLFDYGEAPGRAGEIVVIIDPDISVSGDISIIQYDRPAHNIPDESQAVPFGLKIEDNGFTYSGSETFNVTIGWGNTVQNSSFSNPILVYSTDGGVLWKQYNTDISWTLDGSGIYDNLVSFSITDFTPSYESTSEDPNPSFWALGDKTMFDLDQIDSLTKDATLTKSYYTDGEATYTCQLDWPDDVDASYYRIKECLDPQGTYSYDISAPAYDYGEWTNSGNTVWFVTSESPQEGTYCIESGDITHNQSNQVSIGFDVYEAGNITFYYKVSTEDGWDFFSFMINGETKGSWSGEVAWTQASYAVSVGHNVFTWAYVKDGAADGGSDCAWLDNIVFPESVSDPGTVNPVEDFETGNFSSWAAPAWDGDLLTDSEWECEFSEDEFVSYFKVQGYNGLDNNGSLSDEVLVLRRYPVPLSTTLSNYTFKFPGGTGSITVTEIENLVGDCDVIAQWSDVDQAWNSIGKVPGDLGGWEDPNYSFDKSKPFLINSANELENVFFSDIVDFNFYTAPSYTIQVSNSELKYTMISVSYNTSIGTALELITDVWQSGITEIEVNKLDYQLQSWDQYSSTNGTSGTGDNFDIYPGDVIKIGVQGSVSNFSWSE